LRQDWRGDSVPAMPIEPPQPLDVALALRVQVENLRKLAALYPRDVFYAQSAEQIEAIAAGLDACAKSSTSPQT
jgi:hypothetical protein